MKHSALNPRMNRRHFLAATGMALAAPTFIPASALGADGKAAPSERVTMGVVGWGMQGPSNTDAFLGLRDCQVVAACDLDKNHLRSAIDRINRQYNNQDAKPYEDYRELMARKDIGLWFLALPHGAAADFAKALVPTGVKVIDLSADFRIAALPTFEKYYGHHQVAAGGVGRIRQGTCGGSRGV